MINRGSENLVNKNKTWLFEKTNKIDKAQASRINRLYKQCYNKKEI
jgi:hypothetical protein